jgi:hypothetical protein
MPGTARARVSAMLPSAARYFANRLLPVTTLPLGAAASTAVRCLCAAPSDDVRKRRTAQCTVRVRWPSCSLSGCCQGRLSHMSRVTRLEGGSLSRLPSCRLPAACRVAELPVANSLPGRREPPPARRPGDGAGSRAAGTRAHLAAAGWSQLLPCCQWRQWPWLWLHHVPGAAVALQSNAPPPPPPQPTLQAATAPPAAGTGRMHRL